MTATTTLRLKRGLRLSEQEPGIGHNRWHPDVPPTVHIPSGGRVCMQTLDASDCQITPETQVADLEHNSRFRGHPLTGPVYVDGAEPGDLLAIQIEDIAPEPFGWTSSRPGFGFLRDVYESFHLTRWKIADGSATSADLPGVRIPAASFMGVMGVAPSPGQMLAMRTREAALAAQGGVALPPEPIDALPPALGAAGLRTAPPRENGGNMDIRHLVAGTTLYLPVYVPGALFSTGDAHFAQGDGEVCGTAIEMGATFTGRLEVHKGAAAGRSDPSFEWNGKAPPPHLSLPPRYFATTGVCVRKDGSNASEDATLAARNALLNMIDHVQRTYGFSDVQAYHLCSVAVNLHLSQVVDLPNILVTAFLPLDIFED